MRVCVLLWMAAGLLAQAPPDPSERLVRARDMLAGRDRHLPDYTCLQTVERRYLKRRHPEEPPPSCGQLHALPGSEWKLELSDRLRLEIKASEGKEIGSWKGSRFTDSDVFKLTAGGPYSTGMLGSWITDIFLNGGATYQYLGADAYRYQVPLAASHYLIKAGSQWVTAPFSGAFWLDPNSADLKRLLVEADSLPPETNTCYVNTSVRYEWTQVGAGKFLLPSQSDMRILMRNGREDQTTAVYSGCREYLGESTIRFDEAPAAGPDRAPAAETTPLPPGLHLELGHRGSRVDSFERLIQQQHARAVQQRHGQRGLLAHAVGALVEVGVASVLEAQHA